MHAGYQGKLEGPSVSGNFTLRCTTKTETAMEAVWTSTVSLCARYPNQPLLVPFAQISEVLEQ